MSCLIAMYLLFLHCTHNLSSYSVFLDLLESNDPFLTDATANGQKYCIRCKKYNIKRISKKCYNKLKNKRLQECKTIYTILF